MTTPATFAASFGLVPVDDVDEEKTSPIGDEEATDVLTFVVVGIQSDKPGFPVVKICSPGISSKDAGKGPIKELFLRSTDVKLVKLPHCGGIVPVNTRSRNEGECTPLVVNASHQGRCLPRVPSQLNTAFNCL